jgi:aminopeptidase N
MFDSSEKYILKYPYYFSKYSNANEEHLYDAINEEFLATKPDLYEDVAKIMHTWTRQPGYPLLTITSEEENQLTITQVFELTRLQVLIVMSVNMAVF